MLTIYTEHISNQTLLFIWKYYLTICVFQHATKEFTNETGKHICGFLLMKLIPLLLRRKFCSRKFFVKNKFSICFMFHSVTSPKLFVGASIFIIQVITLFFSFIWFWDTFLENCMHSYSWYICISLRRRSKGCKKPFTLYCPSEMKAY